MASDCEIERVWYPINGKCVTLCMFAIFKNKRVKCCVLVLPCISYICDTGLKGVTDSIILCKGTYVRLYVCRFNHYSLLFKLIKYSCKCCTNIRFMFRVWTRYYNLFSHACHRARYMYIFVICPNRISWWPVSKYGIRNAIS